MNTPPTIPPTIPPTSAPTPTPPATAFCRGVIFDIDGVLCDSEPYIIEAARQMFAESYNVQLTAQAFKPFTGMGEDRFLGGPAEEKGIKINLPRDKKRTYDIYLQNIRGRLQPLPGVIDFIAKLRARRILTACASAADHTKVAGNLTQLGLPPAGFTTVITGSDVTNKKPHPEGFLLAATRMQVPAELCLVVEDAPAGCQAAQTAGMYCLGITSSFNDATLRQAGAQWTAPDLAHVPQDLLEQLNLL